MGKGTIEKKVIGKTLATKLMGWEHEPGKPGYCGYYHYPGPYYFPFSTGQRPSFIRDGVQWYCITDQYFEPWKHHDQAALVMRKVGEVGGPGIKEKIVHSLSKRHDVYRLLTATPEQLIDAVLEHWEAIIQALERK